MIPKTIGIREDQEQWLNENESFNLSGAVREMIDEKMLVWEVKSALEEFDNGLNREFIEMEAVHASIKGEAPSEEQMLQNILNGASGVSNEHQAKRIAEIYAKRIND